MTKIYSYILRIDDGAAPNPFWGKCTLTICKPSIRRNAQIGDWIMGTGSKNTKFKNGKTYDYSDKIIYAMKVTDKMTLKDYDTYCKKSMQNKIPKWKVKEWQLKVGDCIYDYSNSFEPTMRKSVHNEENRKKDLSGLNSLLSNHYYYFGVEAKILPEYLKELIKKNQGHKKIEQIDLIKKFEEWIICFEKNKVYAAPIMSWIFNREVLGKKFSRYAKLDLVDDDTEEILC